MIDEFRNDGVYKSNNLVNVFRLLHLFVILVTDLTGKASEILVAPYDKILP